MGFKGSHKLDGHEHYPIRLPININDSLGKTRSKLNLLHQILSCVKENNCLAHDFSNQTTMDIVINGKVHKKHIPWFLMENKSRSKQLWSRMAYSMEC